MFTIRAQTYAQAVKRGAFGPSRQMEPGGLGGALGDHLAAAHDVQPRGPQPDRLDRIARLQDDEVGVAARLQPVALEAEDARRR